MKQNYQREAVFKSVDKPKQIVYAVVLEPGTFDTQNDIMTEAEIEKSAHRYLVHSRAIDKGHLKNGRGEYVPIAADVVESFIAPVDFMPPGGSELVLKGSWVMAVRVNDREMWQDIERGEYTGFSIGGTGYRTEIE